jgi:hypothetical protein
LALQNVGPADRREERLPQEWKRPGSEWIRGDGVRLQSCA